MKVVLQKWSKTNGAGAAADYSFRHWSAGGLLLQRLGEISSVPVGGELVLAPDIDSNAIAKGIFNIDSINTYFSSKHIGDPVRRYQSPTLI